MRLGIGFTRDGGHEIRYWAMSIHIRGAKKYPIAVEWSGGDGRMDARVELPVSTDDLRGASVARFWAPQW